MLTRSKVRKFKLVSSTNSRMADSNENNGGSNIEFDINNQMGEDVYKRQVVQCVLFNLAIGNDPKGLYIAVVDKELQNGLKDCDLLPKTGCNIHLPLSCRYIETLKEKTIQMVSPFKW